VLAWFSQSDNAVGAEYIIMNEIPGVLLKDVWNTMTASQHITCIQSIAHLVKELCAVDIPYYGSLYSPTGENDDLLAFETDYGIGPLWKPHHSAGELVQTDDTKDPTKNFGPWTNLGAYYTDHFKSAHSRTQRTEHAELLDIAQRTIETLLDQDFIRNAGAPLLSHPDLHTRNIFVLPEDPTVITGIIDWQSAAVEPAYVFAAETPDFAAELPEQEESEQTTDKDSNESQALANLKADVEFCVKTWSIVPSICPKFREASQLDDSVVQLLSAPSNGWLDDAYSLRSMLSNLKQKWTELGLPGESCKDRCYKFMINAATSIYFTVWVLRPVARSN